MIDLGNFDEYSYYLQEMEEACKSYNFQKYEFYRKVLLKDARDRLFIYKEQKVLYFPFKIHGRNIIYPNIIT